MAEVSDDCPHCGARNVSFQIQHQGASLTDRYEWTLLVQCGICHEPVLAIIRDNDAAEARAQPVPPDDWLKAKPFSPRFTIQRLYPAREKPVLPQHTPENVIVPLREAELSFSDGRYSAAGACYRKAIERSLISVAPNYSGTLYKRIKSLEENHIFPPAMIGLLDQVRLFANDAVHDDIDDPTKEDCSAAREFCQLFLTYAFTLPTKIAEAKERASVILPKR